MATLGFLKTLKTAKRFVPLPPPNSSVKEVQNSLQEAVLTGASCSSVVNLLSTLTCPAKLHAVLMDPRVETTTCLQIFNLIRFESHHCFYKLKPDLQAHLTLACRLIRLRYFPDAEKILKNAALSPDPRYPFTSFVSWVENYCKESKIITKLLNLMLKVYSDHHMFDQCFLVFSYMKDHGVQVDERTCTVHLLALVTHLRLGSALDFFRQMVNLGMEISVYSLTVIVKGLCDNGEIKKARELVEEISVRRGIKPNLITCNTLVDACTKRWNFKELPLVLDLMDREGIEFNDSTYKFLIDGYSSGGKVEEAERFILEMHDKGYKVDHHLYSTLIGSYCRQGSQPVLGGLSLLYKLQEKGITLNDNVYRDLVDTLYKGGKLELAKEVVKCWRGNEGREELL